jgi:hypothetical protein
MLLGRLNPGGVILVGHVVYMEEKRIAYTILVGKPE